MRYEVLSQYKVKDESISMAMTVVHSVAEHLKSVSTDIEPAGLSWSNSGSTDSQDSVLYSTLKSDASMHSYMENYRDILCDVHEEPDDAGSSGEDEVEEGEEEKEEGEEEKEEGSLSQHSSASSQQNAEAVCIIEVNEVEE